MTAYEENLRRWRLILGANEADGTGFGLGAGDLRIDNALSALYDSDRQGSLGSSCPNVPRWLGDIREYFPSSVVRVLQRDAFTRLDMARMLTEPELLESVEPDVHLVASLLTMRGIIPSRTKDTARQVVRKVVEQLMQKLQNPMKQAIAGALHRATRNRRPRHNEIDWNRTIRLNLKHYQPDYNTVIPVNRMGYGRKKSSLKQIILCIDQSGSMAASVVYAGVLGAVMASLPTVTTRLIVFDTAVVDLTDELHDPVELLFSTQLGGGTDINKAVTYCQGLMQSPADTVFVLISDLYEGGVQEELLKRAASIVTSGAQFITLLALSDEGAPSYDHGLAAKLCSLGVPSFACTPDLFPDLMAAAINKADINQWASENELYATRK